MLANMSFEFLIGLLVASCYFLGFIMGIMAHCLWAYVDEDEDPFSVEEE